MADSDLSLSSDPRVPPPPPSNAAWPEIARWRRQARETLIAARLAIPADIRAGKAQRIAERLDALVGDIAGKTVSLYWPFRGEPDLRPWLASITERGATAALPIVIEKGQPLEFRAYRPGERLEKGVWNIPVPAEGRRVVPDVVIAPLVGFDSGRFRLGYGGGFFDRTLASLAVKPMAIGVGYPSQQIPTICPRPHDVPMTHIVTA